MTRSISDWVGNIAVFIVVIVANGLANGLPLGGQTTGEISAKYPSLFTPAGFTFSIWGLIYLGLVAFVIYQALPAQRDNKTIARISQLFAASCVANASWIFFWHYDQLGLSLIMMVAMLLALIGIYRYLAADEDASLGQRLFVHLPFSVYTAWITVASIANISAVQTSMGLDDWGMPAMDWTLLKLAVAGAIGATVVLRKGDVAYILVVAWAAFGIMSKQADTPLVAGGAATVALVGVLLAAIEIIRKLRPGTPAG